MSVSSKTRSINPRTKSVNPRTKSASASTMSGNARTMQCRDPNADPKAASPTDKSIFALPSVLKPAHYCTLHTAH